MLIKEVPFSNDNSSVDKYKESHSQKLGRHLIATRRINAGEVILRDNPIIVGPAVFNNNCLCFACLRVIPSSASIVKSNILCSQCQVAVFCSTACEARKSHHTSEECVLFKDRAILSEKESLLPLRLWLVKKRDEKLWEQILQLEAHLEARRGTDVWRNCEENLMNILKPLEGLEKTEENDFPELIQRLCGILDVNSFELRSPGSRDNSVLRGLYLHAALMAHDCRGNTHLTVDDDFQLTIYARRQIDEGELISFNYTSSLMGMAQRREHLREGKYFECECSLCQDPEELGAHLSTVLCPRCRKGLVSLENMNIKDPFVREKYWKCKRCRNSLSGCLIETCMDLIKIRILKTNNSIKELELLIEQLSSTLHPSHYLMLNIKQKLLTLYRSEAANLNPPKKMLNRIINLCNEILSVLEIVEPGISRLKGLILYEIHMPIVVLSNREYIAREITSEELSNKLEQAESYLKRSLTMLLLEPATTPEGILAKRALQEYKALRQHKDDIKSLASIPINKKK